MTKILNIDDLQREAKNYDPVLKSLPFLTLEPALTEMGINLLEVKDGENIEVTFERKAGLLKPYAIGTSDKDADQKEVGKFVEMPLVPKTAYAALKDHIGNYEEKKVLNNVGENIDNQKKDHPLAQLVLEAKVKTVAEDMLDASFHSTYDTSDASPMGISDGFYTIQSKMVVAGDISLSRGNLVNCGSLAAPDPDDEEDFTAYKNIVAWLRKASHSLKNGNTLLYITTPTALAVKDAASNKYRRLDRINMPLLQEILREDTMIRNLRLVTHPALGSGSRVFLANAGLLDYGMTKVADKQFVQIRTPYPDPNWIQFWMQLKLGQRVKSVNPKMFMMSEGSVQAVSLAGDYVS